MKLTVRIAAIEYINELDSYWNDADFKELLGLFSFPDVDQVKPADLREMLFMAITDFEPNDAAEIVLTYKLSEQLNEGQIQAISQEMTNDKVAEEYPEPELHFDLFNINQLLYKAFNGTFPNTEASIITIELLNPEAASLEMTEEIMTKLISQGMNASNLLNRLYSDQIEAKEPFTDAAKFIWKLDKTRDTTYKLMTSRYWIEKDDVAQAEYDCTIEFFEEEH
jgi:hypothetical protein